MSQSPERKIVVVVEDTHEIAQLIKDTLNSEPDFQAVVVTDSALAMEVIRSVKASLIIMDVYLPGISGIELHDLLKMDDGTNGIPVLFVTAAHGDPTFKKRKFDHFIAKPFDLDELLVKVRAITSPS
jgi:DNA-binding response OmpR family regulator